jgi:hypothetical protein
MRQGCDLFAGVSIWYSDNTSWRLFRLAYYGRSQDLVRLMCIDSDRHFATLVQHENIQKT